MLYGSKKTDLLRREKNKGQMTVELAVCIPVILAVLGVLLNVLGYLNVCARFDRVAADAVRSQATSPGYGEEGAALAASRVEEVIAAAFDEGAQDGFTCDFKVTSSPVGWGGNQTDNSQGISFSLLQRFERYECQVTYHPWPFNKIVFLNFFELTHTRSYVVDPFRPGVLL